MNCKMCGASLTYNEIGFNKKLPGKATTDVFCKQCLAKQLKIDVKLLEEKQRQYLQAGYTLFVEE